jgi:hypothetical protein
MPSKRKVLKKGGNCGCNQHIVGGGALGPVSAVNVGPQNMISFNSHELDPLAPANQIATRMEPNMIAPWNPFLSGGKRISKRRNKRTKQTNKRKIKKNVSRRRRIRGGDRNSDAILNGPLYSTGTTMGAPVSANLILGNTLDILNPPKLNTASPLI